MKENACQPKLCLDVLYTHLTLVPCLSLSIDWITTADSGEAFIAVLVQMPQ